MFVNNKHKKTSGGKNYKCVEMTGFVHYNTLCECEVGYKKFV